eukprot:12083.XXX_83810_82989_1 [CDS] Oithona nana genome sequencing.
MTLRIMIFSIWNAYLRVLSKYPMGTQIVQTGTMMSLGDISAQKLVEKADTIDFKRTLRFTIIGSCIVGPMVRTWFITLEKAFGPVITFRKTVQKVVVDQVGFMPVSQSIILTSLGCLQGLDFAQIKAKWKNEIATVVTTGWKIFPWIQMINFYYVPFLLRPLIINIVALFWYTFLAWYANKLKYKA